MAGRIVCGLDIGSSKIATVVAMCSSDTEEPKVLGFDASASRGVKKGLIVDIDQVISAVEESLEKVERMAGHKVNSVFVSVGGPHINSINSHGVVAVSSPQTEINESDVERVIDAARAISLSSSREVIEVLPISFTVDGQDGIKNPLGMSGVRLEVDTHLITASSTNLRNLNRVLDDLGIANDGFIFSGLASASAVLSETEKELGVVLVDIGGGKIDVCLFTEGALHFSSSIPVGAKHITNDIAVGLRVSLESAEKIKLFLSKNHQIFDKSKRKNANLDLRQLQLPEKITDVPLKLIIDEIINSRLEEFYKLIFEEIEKSQMLDKIPSGIVITGGGAMTIGAVEVGKKVLGLPIRIGVPTGITGLIDEILNPAFASVVGLISYGFFNRMVTKDKSKNFNQIFKDFSFINSISKLKNFFKQFIP